MAKIEFTGGVLSPSILATTLRDVLAARRSTITKLGHRLSNWRGSQVLTDENGSWAVMKCEGCHGKVGYYFGPSEHTKKPRKDSRLVVESKLDTACPATAQGAFGFTEPPAPPKPKRRARR